MVSNFYLVTCTICVEGEVLLYFSLYFVVLHRGIGQADPASDTVLRVSRGIAGRSEGINGVFYP